MNYIELGKDVTYFVFSGGEVHIKAGSLPLAGATTIITRDYTANGIMALFQLTQILRERGIGEVHLVLPYVPYARQDRWTDTFQPFSLKVFAAMLNAQNYKSVTMYDPHSDVAPALINHSKVISQDKIILNTLPSIIVGKVLVSPDAGAYKKVSKLTNEDIAVGLKVRNVKTGEITRTEVLYAGDLTGKDCLIVDDICDGGRTFIELAKALRAKGAAIVYLYVTHGIFSNDFTEIAKVIDFVFTTDTFISKYGSSAGFLTIKELNYARN